PEVFQQLLDKGDPMRLSTYIFRDFYNRKNVDMTESMIDSVIDKWDLKQSQRLDYTFPHGNLGPGWWSGMDNLLFPMLLIAFNQEKPNQEYLNLAKAMLTNAIKTPEEGGVLWHISSGGCWLSEYSWKEMK